MDETFAPQEKDSNNLWLKEAADSAATSTGDSAAAAFTPFSPPGQVEPAVADGRADLMSHFADAQTPSVLPKPPSLADLASQPGGLDLKTQIPPAPPSSSSLPGPLKKAIDLATGGAQVGDWRIKGSFTRGDGKIDPRNIARDERKRDEPPVPR